MTTGSERTSSAGAVQASAVAALDPMFYPDSIAIVGMSEKADSFAGRLFTNLSRSYAGELFLVNPAHRELMGRPCHPSISELPNGKVPDIALIVTGAGAAVGLLEQCADLGVPTATLFAAGFGEAQGGGGDRALAVKEVAARTAVRVCGPNTIGLANYFSGAIMVASANVPPTLQPGPLAILSQSGGFGYTFLNKAYSRDLPVGLLAVVGNALDVGISDYVRYFAHRDDIQTIAMYVEASPDLRGLVEACAEAVSQGKDVLLYRAGRTTAGALVAASHTGVLTQNAGLSEQVFASVGVVTHRSFDDLFETTYAAVRVGRLKGRGIAVYSASGGANVQAADLAIESGLEIAALSDETTAVLRDTYPFATASNPYDPTGLWRREPAGLTGCVAAMAQDPAVATLVQVLPAQHAPYAWAHVDVVADARARTDTPIVTASIAAGPLTRPIEDALRSHGVPVFESMGDCFDALGRLAPTPDQRRWKRGAAAPDRLPNDRVAAFDAIMSNVGAGTLDEVTSKQLMNAYGIPVVSEMVAGSAQAAQQAAAQTGYPVVMKTLVPGLSHKTEVGGVRLGLNTPAQVAAAYAEIAHPDHATVIIQPMVEPGLELIVGARRDDQLGPIVMVGSGGIFTELLADVACRLAPLRQDDAAEMIRSLRAARLLDGFRGSAALATEQVERIVVDLGWALLEQPAIVEVDLNPVIVGASAAVAVDASVVVGPVADSPHRED